MNNIESALLTGFICVSYLAYNAQSLTKKIIEINGKLIKNNIEVIKNSTKINNLLYKIQEEHAADLWEFKEFAIEKEQEKIEVINAITEMNYRAAQSMPFMIVGFKHCEPTQSGQEYPFIIIHEAYKDALTQISYLAESEKCWIEPLVKTAKTKKLRIVMDIALFSENEERLEFAKYLIMNRLKDVSFSESTSDKAPCSVKDVRKEKCTNCNLLKKCDVFKKIDLLDFKCPKEEKNG